LARSSRGRGRLALWCDGSIVATWTTSSRTSILAPASDASTGVVTLGAFKKTTGAGLGKAASALADLQKKVTTAIGGVDKASDESKEILSVLGADRKQEDTAQAKLLAAVGKAKDDISSEIQTASNEISVLSAAVKALKSSCDQCRCEQSKVASPSDAGAATPTDAQSVAGR